MKSNIYESHSEIFKIKAIMGGEFYAMKWKEKRKQNVNTFDLKILSEPR
jgi:hypothetical protein